MHVKALGVCGHRLAERHLRVLLAAAGGLDGPKRRIGRRRGRIELHGLLDLLQRGVEVAKARERAAKQDERVHVLRVLLEDPRDPQPRIFELLRGQQESGGLQLHARAVGHQVCRTDVLAVCTLRFPGLRVRLGELQSCFAEARILLQRVPVLHDRLTKLFLRGQAVTAFHVVTLGTFRIL